MYNMNTPLFCLHITSLVMHYSQPEAHTEGGARRWQKRRISDIVGLKDRTRVNEMAEMASKVLPVADATPLPTAPVLSPLHVAAAAGTPAGTSGLGLEGEHEVPPRLLRRKLVDRSLDVRLDGNEGNCDLCDVDFYYTQGGYHCGTNTSANGTGANVTVELGGGTAGACAMVLQVRPAPCEVVAARGRRCRRSCGCAPP